MTPERAFMTAEEDEAGLLHASHACLTRAGPKPPFMPTLIHWTPAPSPPRPTNFHDSSITEADPRSTAVTPDQDAKHTAPCSIQWSERSAEPGPLVGLRTTAPVWLQILKSCLGLTLRPDGSIGGVETACIKKAFTGEIETARRMIKSINTLGCHPFAINLSVHHLVNYRDDYFLTVSDWPNPRTNAVFRMHGLVTHNGLTVPRTGAARHICVAPFDCGFIMASSNLQQMSEEPHLLFPSYNHGLMFSTGLQLNSSVSQGRLKHNIFLPEAIGNDTDVPIYDGRSKFVLSKYRDLPLKKESFVKEGMACMILFMIGFDQTTHPLVDADVIHKTVRLHVQAVIVLADKNRKTDAGAIYEFGVRSASRTNDSMIMAPDTVQDALE